ncbi:hypothetical protein [Arthrobacter sp. SO3]|uniref:hypothetical protein n=1 Tax=Arthrobacter sp. SO3 TaxID=1897057 RepID=UPI001CFF845B|nr:hypothetical protein [Arthrobacter sp. SO3]
MLSSLFILTSCFYGLFFAIQERGSPDSHDHRNPCVIPQSRVAPGSGMAGPPWPAHLLANDECHADPGAGHFSRLDPVKAKNQAFKRFNSLGSYATVALFFISAIGSVVVGGNGAKTLPGCRAGRRSRRGDLLASFTLRLGRRRLGGTLFEKGEVCDPATRYRL